jgi:hypothetical protein
MVIGDLKPRVLKPNIISNITSSKTIKSIKDQNPKIIFSNSAGYLLTRFLTCIINGIIIKTFKTLDNELEGSILNNTFIKSVRKKIVGSQKTIFFKKDVFLFTNNSIIKIIAIIKKVKFIKRLPMIKLIGKKAKSTNRAFSKLFILE